VEKFLQRIVDREEERHQQRVVAFDGIMNLRQISAARHGRKRKKG
jgi:hypothetical protein